MTDGWGDASGIEGNYDNDGDKQDSTESSQSGGASGTRSSTATTETTKTNETNETKTSIKDEWNGRTIYIPDGILDEMEQTYLESQLKLRNAGTDEFKKNRHFYPLLVHFGIEALSGADPDELEKRLREIHDQ